MGDVKEGGEMSETGDGKPKFDPAGWSLRGTISSNYHIRPQPWWAAPMNSQPARTELTRQIIGCCDIKRIIETGTFLGTTTEFFAQFGVPVVTTEIDENLAARSAERLKKWQNVDLRRGHSVGVLQGMLAELIDRSVPTLFYLDAHWQESLPLREEVEVAICNFATSVLMIDDFAVPDDPGYGFDDYGPGKRLDIEYLNTANVPALSVYFPSTPSVQEQGARRGCAVATANPDIAAILDRIPLLRRWAA